MKVTKYQVSRGVYSAMRYLYSAIQVDPNRTTASSSEVVESVRDEIKPSESGGIIVCSTDINAVRLSSNRVANWIKQKAETLSNRIAASKKISSVADANNIYGWTVGRGLKGSYHANDGSIYSENSLCIEVIGVDTDTLIKLAEDMCAEFKQESVMVKDYNTHSIYFVQNDDLVTQQNQMHESADKWSDADKLIEFLNTLNYDSLVEEALKTKGNFNDYRIFGKWECDFGVDAPILNMGYRVYVDVFYGDDYFGQSIDNESQSELKHNIKKLINKIESL